jgi:hypothetical protein
MVRIYHWNDLKGSVPFISVKRFSLGPAQAAPGPAAAARYASRQWESGEEWWAFQH